MSASNEGVNDALGGAEAAVPIEQLERSIMQQMDRQMHEQEQERDARLLDKLDKSIKRVNTRIERVLEGKSTGNRLDELQQELAELLQQRQGVQERMDERIRCQLPTDNGGVDEDGAAGTAAEDNGNGQRDRLIREGKITPLDAPSTTLLDQRPVHTYFAVQRASVVPVSKLHHHGQRSARKRLRIDDDGTDSDGSDRNADTNHSDKYDDESDDESSTISDDYDDEAGSQAEDGETNGFGLESRTFTDDGNLDCYRRRMKRWAGSLETATAGIERDGSPLDIDCLVNAAYVTSNDDAYFDERFKLPGAVYSRLFEYQRIGVKWLWELCQQKVGGIVGDEMGLGKTIQVIAFLAGLYYSSNWPGTAIIVCPATVMTQWVQEFHEWWPAFRVSILHSTGSAFATNPRPSVRKFLDENMTTPKANIIVTTYESIRQYRKQIMNRSSWGFVVLDEGHKIRNPDADITLCCKQFPSPFRIILSGTPIQNNLTELWSLFDFVFPGRLGTLPVFQTQFAVPIRLGGYANASAIQVQAAYKCACILRDLINPYLLRRLKVDVAQWMPKKNEQVLFCKLTAAQRAIYEDFIQSAELQAIFDGKRRIFYGIDILRKICNHPDLLMLLSNPGGKKQSSAIVKHSAQQDQRFGDYRKSGKMLVVHSLLQQWREQGHRVLLFTQTRQMQDILEKMVRQMGITYRRMDGTTPVSTRIPLVDEFNRDNGIFLFLLTTRVGGLGVSLTGANRLIIYDPDWNPSTDIQARERAWRLGQQRDVTIYRLMTSGTIEEKIYHRQIFKQYLTNKILKDPKQRRFFKSNDLHDLFSLAPASQDYNETKDLLESVDDGHRNRNVDFTANQAQDPVLQSLFEMNGLHTVVEHESLMETSRPERQIIEQEASKIAEDAIKAIQQSRQERSRQRISVPTWTGRSGCAGVLQSTSSATGGPRSSTGRPIVATAANFGSGTLAGFSGAVATTTANAGNELITAALPMSSEQLLSNLTADNQQTQLPSNVESCNEQLADGIIRYLNDCEEYKATSSSIISRFKIRVSGEEEVILFRKLLKQIARFERSFPTDRGYWILKNEFRRLAARQ